MNNEAQGVLRFWFEEIPREKWFQKDEEFDALLKSKFLDLHRKISHGETFTWRTTPHGRLAEIIVLDQFSRNMFRDTKEAFATDTVALVLSQCCIQNQGDKDLEEVEKSFLFMPFMHSESKVVHEESIKLFSQLENKENLKYAHMHKDIIDRFGRYPHRNTILGRESTEEEIEFLKGPGSSF